MANQQGKPAVLLVEPSIRILETYSNILHDMGYFSQFQAENGSDALAIYNTQNPGIMIVNFLSPIIGGLSLLRIVRQRDDLEKKTIFILYGRSLGGLELAQIGRLGVAGYIVIPCSLDKYKAELSRILLPNLSEEQAKVLALLRDTNGLIRAGQLDQALKTCEIILNLEENPEVYYNMGYIKSLKGLYNEALGYFLKATMIDGNFVKAHCQMANIFRRLGRLEEAKNSLALAKDLNISMVEDNEPEEIYKEVFKHNPDTTNVYNALGIVYRRQGRLTEALGVYSKALKVHPHDECIYFNLARVHMNMGEENLACQRLKEALKLRPDFKEAISLLKLAELNLSKK